MEEDRRLMAFVRQALEDEPADRTVTMDVLREAAERMAGTRRLRRRVFGWGVPTLLAASVALALAFDVVVRSPAAGRGSCVSDAIELLCAIDGVDTDAWLAKTDAERLMAWQDALCDGCDFVSLRF